MTKKFGELKYEKNHNHAITVDLVPFCGKSDSCSRDYTRQDRTGALS